MFARHKADRTRVPLRWITTGGRSIEAENWYKSNNRSLATSVLFHLLPPLDLRSQAKKLKDPGKSVQYTASLRPRLPVLKGEKAIKSSLISLVLTIYA